MNFSLLKIKSIYIIIKYISLLSFVFIVLFLFLFLEEKNIKKIIFFLNIKIYNYLISKILLKTYTFGNSVN